MKRLRIFSKKIKKHHRPSTRSGNSSSSLHQLSTILGNIISYFRQQFKRLRKGSSTPELNGPQEDLEANNPKSWQKGDIVKDTKIFRGEEYTFLKWRTDKPFALWCSNSKGKLVDLWHERLKRIGKSKYEDNNSKFRKGDRVELLVKKDSIEKGAKGTIINASCQGYELACEVSFDNYDKN
ncbi:MAG: hypothetical protein MHMPM18_002409 [Marteilia pararefringens]